MSRREYEEFRQVGLESPDLPSLVLSLQSLHNKDAGRSSFAAGVVLRCLFQVKQRPGHLPAPDEIDATSW